MKINKLFFASLAILATLVSCKDKEEPSTAPSLSIDKTEVELGKEGGSATITLTTNRDWTATTADKWITIEPAKGSASGEAQEVTITALPNTGTNRTGSVLFSIGVADKTIKVSQAGEGGSLEAATVYKNDFDKEVAELSGTKWPFLDQFEGWKNATGTGVGSETYAFSGITARANSTSNSSYSDYTGSGKNNLFFGTKAYFAIQGIALPENTNYTLSFGSEKYTQSGSSLFDHSEFHVYISNDGAKWVELEYAFPNGDKEGRWDLASTTFTVPAGTSSLSIYVAADVASVYRLDDLSLVISSTAGTDIDFSKGTEIGGGSTDIDYTKVEAKTVAEFIALADNNTYYKLTGTVSGFNSEYCSFDITDETGSAYVYSVANKADWSSKISNGGTVILAGKYLKYTTSDGTVKNEVVEAQILSFVAGEGGNEGGSEGGNEGGETPGPEVPEEGLVYVLDGSEPWMEDGSTNGYAAESVITQSSVSWSVTGNTQVLTQKGEPNGPWRIGGKNLTDVDRAIYSTTAIPGKVASVSVVSGDATLTVNSITITVHGTAADAASGDSAIATFTTSTDIVNNTVSLEADGDAWENCFYRIVYNVTNKANDKNQFVKFISAKFYE